MTPGSMLGEIDLPGYADEFDAYLTGALRDPEFRAAFKQAELRARHWDVHHPLPLAIDGHEYRRRQLARRRRRRR